MNEENKISWLKRLSNFWQEEDDNPQTLLNELLTQMQSQQLIDNESALMIENVIKINNLQVRDIMIPRGQMILIEENSTVEEALQVVLENGHSRYPVVDEEHRQLRGVLLAKDLLPVLKKREEVSLLSLLRKATIVPESKAVNAMLRDFRNNRNHMALVIDEYGALSGLVTIEDVIEEIVGEIDDEHDEIPDALIIANNDGSFQVNALAPITDLNNFLNLELSDEDSDTIGGYILDLLGRMPSAGEILQLENWQVTILKANQKRLILLHFQQIDNSEVDSEKE